MRGTYVYILYSEKIDRYYVGVSKDPDKRLRYHNLGKGGGKRCFTKRTGDWRIVWKCKFGDIRTAKKVETKIKKQKSRRYIEDLIGDNLGP